MMKSPLRWLVVIRLTKMLPQNLALIEDDRTFADVLAKHLAEHGVPVSVFGDSNELLTHAAPYGYDFYIVDLGLPGIDGVALIELLRRCTDAGLIVVSGRIDQRVFDDVMRAGADMYLAKPVAVDQVLMAIRAVHRRAARAARHASEWHFDRRAGQLVAPDGARIDLSAVDVTVLECFLAANGQTVPREVLRQRLGRSEARDADGLNATVYRLRRRVARVTSQPFPLQSKSRVGYLFRAPLKAI